MALGPYDVAEVIENAIEKLANSEIFIVAGVDQDQTAYPAARGGGFDVLEVSVQGEVWTILVDRREMNV